MTDPSRRAVVVAARRTPLAVRGGRLREVDVDRLATTAIAAVVADARAALGAAATPGPLVVRDVVMGNCMGPGGNLGRHAALGAGLGVEVPGMMLDRQCASGLAAILTGAALLTDPHAHAPGPGIPVIVAGGAESASTAPPRLGADGQPYPRAPFAPDGFPDPDMPRAAQDLAMQRGIDRPRQDAYAVRSHHRALAAAARGAFATEIAPVTLPSGEELAVDEGPRRAIAALAGRMPALYDTDPRYALTGANCSRNTDGAAAVALVAEDQRGDTPGLALVAARTIGCDPAMPGLGPVGAVRCLLADAGVGLEAVAAIELVEAFSAQALAVLDDLGLARPHPAGDAPADGIDPRVCADGGALALGHPWGGSAAVSVVRLYSRLVSGGAPAGALGLAAVAAGGGMGVAALFEVVR